MTSHEFLWLDLETTGLDPATGVVLEFAAVLCEDAMGDDMAVVAQYEAAIRQVNAIELADERVRKMHAANGLWSASATSKVEIAEVDEFLAGLASTLAGGRKRSVVLAGSSVHFDLAWSRVHFPRFAEYLSHRVFDVTTFRRAVTAWCPNAVEWPYRDAHRAMPDILATIAECRVARKALGI